MKKIIYIFVLFLSLNLFPLSSKAWTVSPVRFEIEGEKGKEYTFAFSVLNESQLREVRFETKVDDWVLSEDNTFLVKGHSKGLPDVPYSAKPWIRITPQQFVIPPGGVRKVRFTVTIPQDLPSDGDYTSVILVGEKNLEEPPKEKGVFIKQTTFVGVVLYATVGEKTKNVVLNDLDFKSSSVAEGLNRVTLINRFENKGNTHSRGNLYIKLKPISYPDIVSAKTEAKKDEKSKGNPEILPLGEIKKEIDGGEVVLMREAMLNFEYPLEQFLPAGSEWEVEVKADFGKNQPILVGKKTYKVPFVEIEKPKVESKNEESKSPVEDKTSVPSLSPNPKEPALKKIN